MTLLVKIIKNLKKEDKVWDDIVKEPNTEGKYV